MSQPILNLFELFHHQFLIHQALEGMESIFRQKQTGRSDLECWEWPTYWGDTELPIKTSD